jgi:hypothetical protein
VQQLPRVINHNKTIVFEFKILDIVSYLFNSIVLIKAHHYFIRKVFFHIECVPIYIGDSLNLQNKMKIQINFNRFQNHPKLIFPEYAFYYFDLQ